MIIYARTNRPFLAVKVYQRFCAVLDRELNVTPMPAIEWFYQKLTSKMLLVCNAPSLRFELTHEGVLCMAVYAGGTYHSIVGRLEESV